MHSTALAGTPLKIQDPFNKGKIVAEYVVANARIEVTNSDDKIIEFRSVGFAVDGVQMLAEIDLAVTRGETLVLLGESGCGKTTTLKLINRLIEPTEGEVLVNGRSTLAVDAVELRRGIGYVLQEGGLFPHMTVSENVGLPLRLAGLDSSSIENRVAEMLELVDLAPDRFAARFPHELSGGQRQRLGVARALVADPDLLLLDEPFGALDALTRAALQQEFARIVRELGKTAVFVTHDLHEAMLLGSRIALMEKGRIVFLGTPKDFAAATLPLARAYLETVAL
ncbi:MAG: ATP-binding cassette domain-containing protein [Acidobacteria bacterium]|nr:ATP-binding cassette domain-containing protein [Acidobacteriota bacterium]